MEIVVSPSKFNSWRNGPDFTETCRVLNERDIDYVSWTDMDMYVWFLNNL